jgi:hypothetical protein
MSKLLDRAKEYQERAEYSSACARDSYDLGWLDAARKEQVSAERLYRLARVRILLHKVLR